MSPAQDLRCRVGIAATRVQKEIHALKARGQSAQCHELPLRRLAALLRGINNTWTMQMIKDTNHWLKQNHGL